ncbi:hypothetical protein [Pseudomonas alliivorans]|nr:hypothetical protein [Pseudomonas alliivorans]MEE5072215.1 hypothetical protein [Pseudomonas alliivorans]
MDASKVEKFLPTFNAFHPLGRNGQPADVAQAMLFRNRPGNTPS